MWSHDQRNSSDTSDNLSTYGDQEDQHHSLLGKSGTTMTPSGNGLSKLQDEDESSACFINRWWKLALFLVFWTCLLPIVVNTVHGRSFKTSSASNTQSDESNESRNDYVLDSHWNFDEPPKVRSYEWTIEDIEYNPDGVYRPMILINQQFPGPLIEVNEHDTLRVIVKNQAVNATTIHWHGMYQNGTNHMDGTAGITQCPIAPGSSFTYEFTISGQSGTYWYHGHQGLQASDGLFGPLIVHSKQEKSMQKIEYDTDRVVMVSDHYHDTSGTLTRQYMAPDRENVEPVPDTALINGRAVRDCSTLPHRKCDNTTANVAMPTFDLAPGQNHRLRIINTGALAEFQFQVDEHELAVTEVDGTDVWPINYHRLSIVPGQRYSIVITAESKPASSFWMRARMVASCFREDNPYLQNDALGVVRYRSEDIAKESSQDQEPTSIDWSDAQWVECKDLNTTELVPVEEVQAPEADVYLYTRANFEIGDYRLSRGFMNTSTFRPNVRSPTLLRTIDGLKTSNSSFDSPEVSLSSNSRGSVFVNDQAFAKANELVVQSSGIQTIDILLHNFEDANHPFHLHGYKFFVLAQGHAAPPHTDRFSELHRWNVEPLYSSLNLTNPLRRDTVSVEGYGWALIRFVADNPGVWALHCHIAWHSEAGLLMQFATRTDLLGSMTLPEANLALCDAPLAELEKGTAPKDEVYIEEMKNGG